MIDLSFAYILMLIIGTGQTSWLIPDAPYNNPSLYKNTLTSVSCDKEGQLCTSVGFYLNDNTLVISPLSYTTINGGQTWSPATVITVPMNFTDTQLNAVS